MSQKKFLVLKLPDSQSKLKIYGSKILPPVRLATIATELPRVHFQRGLALPVYFEIPWVKRRARFHRTLRQEIRTSAHFLAFLRATGTSPTTTEQRRPWPPNGNCISTLRSSLIRQTPGGRRGGNHVIDFRVVGRKYRVHIQGYTSPGTTEGQRRGKKKQVFSMH